MRILFLSYWGINEGLTAATVFPHLEILDRFAHIEKIILVTIERNQNFAASDLPESTKIVHIPLLSKRPLPNFFNKIYDFIDFPRKIIRICSTYQIDKIIARGAPPGAIAMQVAQKTGIPFCVESFEPHSEYMLESGTWHSYDPRYIFQRKWEWQQTQKATALMPVAENYKKRLVAEGVPHDMIDVMPCCVPLEQFRFSTEHRKHTREELSCDDLVTGIYTGKFGGIYYREEAFRIFKHVFNTLKNNFFLIILSPDDPVWIRLMLQKHQIPLQKVFYASVAHGEVPLYLSAADFAFSLQSPKKSNLYLSPIKNAEYWAAGLPILITAGVGDDAKIIREENAGAIFRGVEDVDGLKEGILKLVKMVREENPRPQLQKLASRYRNFSIVEAVYKKWYGK
ncbi:MAG: glycosyltransferase [Bacteroidota bacterium]